MAVHVLLLVVSAFGWFLFGEGFQVSPTKRTRLGTVMALSQYGNELMQNAAKLARPGMNTVKYKHFKPF
jgi:hypothetical protein